MVNISNPPPTSGNSFIVGIGITSDSNGVSTLGTGIFFDATQSTLNGSTLTGHGAGGTNAANPALPPPGDTAPPPANLLSNVIGDTPSDDSNNQSDDNNPLTDNGSQTDDNSQTTYVSDFNAELAAYAKANNLSTSDIAQLQFAFYNSNVDTSTTNLSNGTSLSEVLQNIEASAQTDAGGNVTSPNNQSFNLNVSDGYNNLFTNNVNSSSLTASQKGALIYMFYNPDAQVSSSPNLQALLTTYENKALQQAGQKFGFPAGWTPPSNNAPYNASINGNFEVNLQTELNTYASQQGLTSDQITALQTAIETNDPSNAAAQAIIAAATKDSQTANNLPGTWQPSAAQLTNVFNNISSSPVTPAFVSVQEMLSSLAKNVKLLMPDGPNKTVTLSMLQTISAAIVTAQNAVYALEESQSQQAKGEATAQLGQTAQQIREQQAEQAEIATQLGKQEKMTDVMNVLGPIMKVMEVCMDLVTGGVMAAVFGALDCKFNLVSKLVKDIMQGVGDLVDDMLPNGSTADKEALNGFCQVMGAAMVLALGCTAGLAVVGPGTFMDIAMQMFSKSITEFSEAGGASSQTAQWIALGVTVAITLAFAIATAFAGGGTVVTDLPGAAETTMNTNAEITEEATNTVQPSLEYAQNAKVMADASEDAGDDADITSNAADGAGNAADGVGNAVDDGTLIYKGAAGGVRGATQQAIDAANAMIKNLMKILKQLWDSLSSALGNAVSKIEDSSQTISNNLDPIANSVTNTADDASAAVSRVLNSVMSKVGDVTKPFTNAIDRQVDNVNNIINKVLEGIMNRLKTFQSFQRMLNFGDNVGDKFSSFTQTKAFSRLIAAANISQTLVQGANSGLQGGVDITNINISKAKEAHEPEIEKLKAMIKQLQSVLNKIMEGLSDASEDLKGLVDLYNNLLQTLESTVTKIVQS